jgi:hypothetical protein
MVQNFKATLHNGFSHAVRNIQPKSRRFAATFGAAPASSPAAAILVNHGLSYPTPVNLSYF